MQAIKKALEIYRKSPYEKKKTVILKLINKLLFTRILKLLNT